MKIYDKNKLNMKLYKRLNDIERRGKRTVFGKMFSKNNELKIKGKNIIKVKNNIKEIAQENLFMYKRLSDKQPTYDMEKYLREYDRNQMYKQNACKYPSINFYNENKKKNVHSCSINAYKRKTKSSICKTEFDHFPKINNTITTNYSTNNNTCEEFGKKRRLYKGRKKKFENFTFSDLKMLKLKRNKSNCIFSIMRPSRTTNNLDSDINNEDSKKIEVYEKIETNRNEDNNSSSHSDKKSENENSISNKDLRRKNSKKSEKDISFGKKDKDESKKEEGDDIEDKEDKDESNSEDNNDSISKNESKSNLKSISKSNLNNSSLSHSKSLSKNNSKNKNNNSKSSLKSNSKDDSKVKSKNSISEEIDKKSGKNSKDDK